MYSIINLQKNKIAVCLYLYHTDLWQEFKRLLFPIRDDITLYLALSKEHQFPELETNEFSCKISYHDNYGADVAPFLHQLSVIDEPYFVKLHSKKSFWGFKFHINWRHLILNDLLGSIEIFQSNIESLNSPRIGAICGKPLLMKNRELKNREKIKELCSLINMDYNIVKNSYFMAGNMFIGKTDLYRQTFISYMAQLDEILQQEQGKISDTFYGTYTHSIERLFGYIIEYNKLNFANPKHKYIKILNTKAPNKKYFHMITTFDNHCYLLEDANVYGKIIDINSDTSLIEWTHMNTIVGQRYKIISPEYITKIQ